MEMIIFRKVLQNLRTEAEENKCVIYASRFCVNFSYKLTYFQVHALINPFFLWPHYQNFYLKISIFMRKPRAAALSCEDVDKISSYQKHSTLKVLILCVLSFMCIALQEVLKWIILLESPFPLSLSEMINRRSFASRVSQSRSQTYPQ